MQQLARKDSWFSKVLRELRNDAMIIFFSAALMLVTFLFLLLLDENLSAKKKDFLREGDLLVRQIELISRRIRDIWSTAARQGIAEGQFQAYVQREIYRFLDEENVFYRIRLIPKPRFEHQDLVPPPTTVEHPGKLARMNTFRNSLIRRDFTAIAAIREIPLGSYTYRIEAYYGTPMGDAQIDALAGRYKIYGLGAIAAALAVFFTMYFGIFLPMRKVVKCLGEADRQGVQILAKPRALIEGAYNHLARNTIVQQIGLALTDWASTADPLLAVQSREGLGEIGSRISPYLRRSNVFGRVWMFMFVPSGTQYVAVGDIGAPQVQITERDGEIELTTHDGQTSALPPALGRNLFANDRYIAATLEVDDQHYGAMVVENMPRASSFADADRALVAEVANKIEQTLSNIASHLLRSEKQKADISVALSTSMGHDLTNMIATSKWDIRTVQMYLDRVLPKLGDDRQALIFGQSLQGLLNNMQLLQEVVDLYRSLGLTKRPQYELTNMNHLVDDAVNLFQFSTSRNVVLTTEHEKGLAELAVEPRLLKVALFNLLSNAGQACAKRSIQIGQSEEKYLGEIHVQTRSMDDDHVAIEICDNGTGFLDKEGNRLPKDHIHRTFRSGYTTKTGRVAGGLGLSWVQTIVRDLHAGDIEAENLEPSGALIRILLPVRKDPDALNAAVSHQEESS